MKTKKIILTCILIIILTFISNNIVIAGIDNSDEYMSKATIKSRYDLSLKTHYSGYESNEGDVGQTIAVKTGNGRDSYNQPGTNMSDEYDHIYCIKHDDEAANSLMLIRQFINVRGDEATAYWLNNGGTRITNRIWDYYDGTISSAKLQSRYNIALSYVLSKYDNVRKAYSMNSKNRVRQHALNILLNMQLKSTWGTKLLYNDFYDNDDDNYSSYSNWLHREARDYVEKDYNFNLSCIPKISITSATTEITPEITGPYHFDFGVENEAAQWIYPIDANGNWIGGYYEGRKWENGRYVSNNWVVDNTISFYKDYNCTEPYNSVSEIKSGSYFYIKNTSGKKIKQVQIKAASGYKNIQTDTKQIEYISNLIGPISMEFKGRIQWIWPLDTNGNWLGENEFIVCNDKGQEIKNENITSNTVFYIKNNSNKKIDKIHIKLCENTIMCSEIWWLQRMDGKAAQRLVTVDTSTEMANSIIIIKAKLKTRDLIINKKDSITNNNITSPAEFKIKTSKGKWLTGTSGSYNYENSDVSLATKYRTNANGVLELKDLLVDTYEIFEVASPNGYDIQKQNGYDKTNNWINCGKVDLNVTNSNVTISIKNDLIISISGRVWEEKIPNKGSFEDYDSKYLEVDDPLPGIKVRLKNKRNGKPVITNSKGDDFVLTDANGMYKFDNLIKKIELENYYVEFDYSSKNKEGEEYIRYIPVAFNKDKTNGSKALANMPTQDREVKGIATTYTGEDRNQIATYGLEKTGTYNAQTLTLGDINLGIKPLLDPEYDLRENIADLKLTIKGYTYTYVYGGKGKKDNFVGNGENGPSVKWQNSQDMYAYSRQMYPSDIIYDKNSSKKELEALVTYRIDVTNTMSENTKELYQQTDKLILTRIENQYDTKRYELVDSNWKDENGSGTATMNDNYKQTVYSNGVGSNNTATSYITFKVKEEALEKILENPDGIIEENPTKITTEAYHTYYRDDYMWENLGKTGKNIDGVKYKENLHQTRNKVKEEKAPYLVFSIDEQRTISGKVFEDKVITNNGEKLGDGIYNEGREKGVEGVKVELLDIGGTAPTLSHLYQGIKNGENKKIEEKIVDAIVTTNSEGEYRLEGVVPGRYYLRFIYGNGDYRVTNLKGEEVEKGHLSTKLEGKEINAKEYKSTIIKSSIVESALKFVEQITDSMTEEQKQAYEKQLIEDTYTWYKKDEFKEQKYSVAVDDLNVRKALNESQENLNAEALSPQISVTIENTKNNSATESEGNDNKIDGAKDESGKTVSNISILNNKKENVKNIFEGFYFGIIETPKQNAEIEKIITNVKLTNAQGNILYNGNPENVSTQGAGAVSVSDLDNKKNGGSSYVRAEMVEESLYGSSLELTYEVRITNTSDVNYYNTEYYVYGQKKDNKEVTLKPIVVKEYLDETLKYEEEKSQKDRIEEVNPNVAETIKVEGKDVKAQEFNLNGWSTLYTNKITNRDQEHPTTDKVTLVATRILSKEDDDMEIVSRAEIKEIEHTPDPKDNEEDKVEQLRTAAKEVHTNGMEKATFTITPPTGENKNNVTLYAIVGIISLLILSTGIVILKRKLL